MSMLKMCGVTAAAVFCLMLSQAGRANAAEANAGTDPSESTVTDLAPGAALVLSAVGRDNAGSAAGASDLMSYQGPTSAAGLDRPSSSRAIPDCAEIPTGPTICCIQIVWPICWVQ